MTLTGEFAKFHKTAQMRNGVLCWYPFASDARVLDATGGILTELLNERCETVVPATEATLPADRYDYLVILDPPRLDATTLAAWRLSLKEHGRLLLAVENPFALRYWAGHSAPTTGQPYDTLRGKELSSLISKAELTLRLGEAGFTPDACKWYYPLADHWLTTEVYSDAYLPNEFLNQRFVPYLDSDPHRCFDENPLLREVIRNGAFTFLCSSYLLEARRDGTDPPCTVDYAAVTAYRAPDRRFATTLNNNGKAYKRPLAPDAATGIERIAANHTALRVCGVNALACAAEHDDSGMPVLVMPRVELPTLLDHWATCLTRDAWDQNEIIRLYDRIRHDIYKAAKTGSCFWELVPANCFYNAAAAKTEDELTYFDQEYRSEGADPDLALARAVSGLKYSPLFATAPAAQRLYRQLLKRYDLVNTRRDAIKLLEAADTYHEVFGPEHQRYQLISMKNAERFKG
ncbi:MAG: hypothetical protein LBK67_00055 [Coriobacteriales bacterium]|jgi:hypothetical protein|nr:hypothetical protein [Coriobacteriales bacterium]